MTKHKYAHAGGVYAVTNVVDGKVYIGATASFVRRFANHRYELRRGRHWLSRMQSAWDTHGEGVFTFEPVLFCDKGGLSLYEEIAVKAYKANEECCGYNRRLFSDSFLGRVHTEETKAKMSAAMKGIPKSDAHRAKISAARSGRALGPQSAEHRANISAALRRLKQAGGTYGISA